MAGTVPGRRTSPPAGWGGGSIAGRRDVPGVSLSGRLVVCAGRGWWEARRNPTRRMRTVRPALLILLGSLLLLTGCGSAGSPEPEADAASQRWVLAYTRQLDRWADGAAEMARAIDEQAWGRLGRIVRRMGRDGGRVRERFAEIPPALAGAGDLYALLLEAGEAASA